MHERRSHLFPTVAFSPFHHSIILLIQLIYSLSPWSLIRVKGPIMVFHNFFHPGISTLWNTPTWVLPCFYILDIIKSNQPLCILHLLPFLLIFNNSLPWETCNRSTLVKKKRQKNNKFGKPTLHRAGIQLVYMNEGAIFFHTFSSYVSPCYND